MRSIFTSKAFLNKKTYLKHFIRWTKDLSILVIWACKYRNFVLHSDTANYTGENTLIWLNMTSRVYQKTSNETLILLIWSSKTWKLFPRNVIYSWSEKKNNALKIGKVSTANIKLGKTLLCTKWNLINKAYWDQFRRIINLLLRKY